MLSFNTNIVISKLQKSCIILTTYSSFNTNIVISKQKGSSLVRRSLYSFNTNIVISKRVSSPGPDDKNEFQHKHCH